MRAEGEPYNHELAASQFGRELYGLHSALNDPEATGEVRLFVTEYSEALAVHNPEAYRAFMGLGTAVEVPTHLIEE